MRFHFHPFKSLSNLIKKEAVPWGTASFLAESKGFLLVFIVYHEGTNFLKTTDICATGGKRSTGAFSISPFRIPCYFNKKRKKHLSALLPFWRRARDSNPRTVLGGYTISNRAPSTSSDNSPNVTIGIISKFREKIKTFFQKQENIL